MVFQAEWERDPWIPICQVAAPPAGQCGPSLPSLALTPFPLLPGPSHEPLHLCGGALTSQRCSPHKEGAGTPASTLEADREPLPEALQRQEIKASCVRVTHTAGSACYSHWSLPSWPHHCMDHPQLPSASPAAQLTLSCPHVPGFPGSCFNFSSGLLPAGFPHT